MLDLKLKKLHRFQHVGSGHTNRFLDCRDYWIGHAQFVQHDWENENAYSTELVEPAMITERLKHIKS